MVETRAPQWPEEDMASGSPPEFRAVAIQGRYEDYLEGRLPTFVQSKHHWCSKGLTNIQLDPLGEACGLQQTLEFALYSPPSSGASLQKIHEGVVEKLVSADARAMDVLAHSWASRMSKPEFTHPVTGAKLNKGWTKQAAAMILEKLTALAKAGGDGTGMYLLIET